MTFYGVGGVCDNLDYLQGTNNIGDYSDIFFFTFNLILIAFQITLFTKIVKNYGIRPIILDFAVTLTSIGSVVWFLLRSEYVGSQFVQDTRNLLTLAFYVITDSFILFNFIVLLIRPDANVFRLPSDSYRLICLSLIGYAASDLLWAALKLRGLPILPDGPSTLVIYASNLVMILAVIRFLKSPAMQREAQPAPLNLTNLVPFLMTATSLGLLLVLGYNSLDSSGRTLIILLSLSTLLALLRQLIVLTNEGQLKVELAVKDADLQSARWFRDQGANLLRLHHGRGDLLDRTIWLQPDPGMDGASEASDRSPLPSSLAERLRIVRDRLDAAIDGGWFVPWYQPICRLGDTRIGSVEVLARCNHPKLGMLGTEAFIDLVEAAGLSGKLLDHLARTAFSDMARLTQSKGGHPPIRMGLNATAADVQDALLADRLLAALKEHGLAPGSVYLELTERTAVDLAAPDHSGLSRLKKLGIGVAIDDFGTGFSSMSYLSKIDVDLIKIDKSLIDDIEHRRVALDLVAAIIALGERLGLDVVVEGIETEKQRALLRRLGCQFGQGFLFAEPMPFTEFEAMVARTSTKPRRAARAKARGVTATVPIRSIEIA